MGIKNDITAGVKASNFATVSLNADDTISINISKADLAKLLDNKIADLDTLSVSVAAKPPHDCSGIVQPCIRLIPVNFGKLDKLKLLDKTLIDKVRL
jgi:hypothetical protein